MVKIIADSTSDMTFEALELRKKFDIDILPLSVTLGDKIYRDGDITPEEIFAWSDANNSTPNTTALSLVDCYTAFKPYADEGRDIVFVCISSDLSGTCQAARLAAKEFTNVKIEVVDSRSLSCGVGLLAFKAAGLAQRGLGAEEIASELRVYAERIHTGFLIDTITYLHRGGRCSSLEAFGAKILNLKPEIGMSDGKLHAVGKFRGSIDKVLPKYVMNHKDEIATCDPEYIFMVHTAGVQDETIASIRAMIKDIKPDANVYETIAGATISSHCGPGTLGVIYMMKE